MVSSQNEEDLCFCYSLVRNGKLDFLVTMGTVNIDKILKEPKHLNFW